MTITCVNLNDNFLLIQPKIKLLKDIDNEFTQEKEHSYV